jgi:hypothetical protein
VGWFAVSQIGRQRRDLGLDVVLGAIPVQQGLDGEGMTQVVQPRRVRCVGADSGGGDELSEVGWTTA